MCVSVGVKGCWSLPAGDAVGGSISPVSQKTHTSLTHSHTPAGSFESLIKFKLICFWTVGGNWNLPLGENSTFTIGINFLL